MVIMIENVKYKQANKKKKILLVATLVALVAVLGLGYYYYSNRSHNKLPATETTNEGGKIVYTPATDQEKAESEAHKEDIAKNDEAIKNQDASTVKQVIPVVTRADTSSAAGYVPGVFEDGGTCTFTFTAGATSFVKQSTGAQNATNTSCVVTGLTSADFSASKNWSVTLTYKSPKATGTSQPMNFGSQ